MLHYQTVSPDLTAVLKKLMQVDELSAFRLVGGTSLSLQMGHLFPIHEEDNIRLMQAEEIGAMKFEAITNRKEKKDFYDIAFLFKIYSLKHLLNVLCRSILSLISLWLLSP